MREKNIHIYSPVLLSFLNFQLWIFLLSGDLQVEHIRQLFYCMIFCWKLHWLKAIWAMCVLERVRKKGDKKTQLIYLQGYTYHTETKSLVQVATQCSLPSLQMAFLWHFSWCHLLSATTIVRGTEVMLTVRHGSVFWGSSSRTAIEGNRQ